MARAVVMSTVLLAVTWTATLLADSRSAPSDSVIQWSLLCIVAFGCVVNGVMALLTAVRWFRYDPCNAAIASRLDGVKTRIGCITIRRAFRVEVGFFLCQLARLLHSVHTIRHGYAVDTTVERAYAAIEREFATLMLVFLSLADLLDARRQSVLQETLLGG